jgi:hypothetical protein
MIRITLLTLQSLLIAENQILNQATYDRISGLRKRLHRTVREISSFVKSFIRFVNIFSVGYSPPRQSQLYCSKTAFAPIIIAYFRQLVEYGGVVCIDFLKTDTHQRLTFSI